MPLATDHFAQLHATAMAIMPDKMTFVAGRVFAYRRDFSLRVVSAGYARCHFKQRAFLPPPLVGQGHTFSRAFRCFCFIWDSAPSKFPFYFLSRILPPPALRSFFFAASLLHFSVAIFSSDIFDIFRFIKLFQDGRFLLMHVSYRFFQYFHNIYSRCRKFRPDIRLRPYLRIYFLFHFEAPSKLSYMLVALADI